MGEDDERNDEIRKILFDVIPDLPLWHIRDIPSKRTSRKRELTEGKGGGGRGRSSAKKQAAEHKEWRRSIGERF